MTVFFLEIIAFFLSKTALSAVEAENDPTSAAGSYSLSPEALLPTKNRRTFRNGLPRSFVKQSVPQSRIKRTSSDRYFSCANPFGVFFSVSFFCRLRLYKREKEIEPKFSFFLLPISSFRSAVSAYFGFYIL